MFRSLLETLSDEISGPATAQTVAEIARFHRIQASPGFRRAAEWIFEHLNQAGLQTQVLSYPAETSTRFWSLPSFQEWDASGATLRLVEPAEHARLLADYRSLPLSLVARSTPFDGEAEVVVLDKGEEPEEYEGVDVRGKVVLVRGNVRRVHDLAVIRRGAVGLIYDGMKEIEPVRPAWSLPDAVQYTSFWWWGGEPQGFGFALTPRQGERLRRLAREHALRVHVRIDARLYDGWFEVVEATIPGRTDQEVVLIAHLCHPHPSANDNGSGAATLLEIARALQLLIARGALASPMRTIRFLWVPEMTGTFAYLSAHEDRIPRMVAGLNLDMVGQDQEQCGSVLLFERTPDALPSFTGALLARLRESLLPEVKPFGGTKGYPLFRYADTSFSGGSDHYIFSDPSVGVPMPMVIQWPDRFYHTSADTPDRVDPQMLARVGCLAAGYAYWLAQAGEGEARWLAHEMSSRFRRQVIGALQDAITHADDEDNGGREAVRRRLEYWIARHREGLQSLQRLAPIAVARRKAQDTRFARSEWTRVSDLLPERPPLASPEVAGVHMVPRRQFRGPVQVEGVVAQQNATIRDRWWHLQQRFRKVALVLPPLAQYWADGQRTVAEIADLVRCETGHEATELLVEYFSILAELGLVEVR